MRHAHLKYLVVTVGAWLAICSPAAAGVDPTFGTGGSSSAELAPAYRPAAFTKLLAFSDGSVDATYTGTLRPEARRYEPSGAVDPSFSRGNRISQAVTAADGRKFVVEEELEGPGPPKVARLLADGSPDPSWTVTSLKWSPAAIGVGPSGRLLVATSSSFSGGGHTATSLSIQRLNANGGIDSGFGTDGVAGAAAEGFGLSLVGSAAIAERGDGGVVVATTGSSLLGFTASGQRDPGFGSGEGLLPVAVDPEAVQSLPDGRFVVAGNLIPKGKENQARSDFAALRYLADGTLDKSFGDSGLAVVDLGGDDRVKTALLRSDGSLVIGGATLAETANCRSFYAACRETPVLTALDSGGQKEPGFGSGGSLRLSTLEATGNLDGAGVGELAERQGGGLVAGGRSGPTGFLAATTAAGQLDPAFGGGLIAERTEVPSTDEAVTVGVDRGGRLLVGAATNAGLADDGGPPGALLRYGPDGNFEPGFGGAGGVKLPAGVSRVAIDRSGRALVLGGGPGITSNAVTRVTADGRIDPGYGLEGTAVVAPRLKPGLSQIVATAKGGALLVGGIAGTRVPSVIRLRPDGSLDRRFGRQGVSTLHFGGKGGCTATAATAAGEGKLLIAGDCVAPRRIFVARTRSGGGLDPAFGKGGVTIVKGAQPGEATAVSRQDRGVLVAGSVWTRGSSRSRLKYVLLRFNSHGRRDRGFGSRGMAVAGVFGGKRGGGCGGKETASILTPGRRIVLVRNGPGQPVTGFRADGTRIRSYGSGPAIAAGRYPWPSCSPGPIATLQGGKPVLAWTGAPLSVPPLRITLQRLTG